MAKTYLIDIPAHVFEMKGFAKENEYKFDCFHRVWKASTIEKGHAKEIFATVEFSTKGKKVCTMYRHINGAKNKLGECSYNKAVNYCKKNLRMLKGETKI